MTLIRNIFDLFLLFAVGVYSFSAFLRKPFYIFDQETLLIALVSLFIIRLVWGGWQKVDKLKMSKRRHLMRMFVVGALFFFLSYFTLSELFISRIYRFIAALLVSSVVIFIYSYLESLGKNRTDKT